MITYSVKKFDKVIFSLSAIIPWTLLLSVIVFYLHASFVLGHNPTFAHPDPKDLKMYSFYGVIINPLLFIWSLTFLIWLIALIIFLQGNSWKDYRRKLIPAIVGHIFCIILFFSPLMDWYMD
jgi:magnesium-transporting ATPase (P-type)